MTAALQHVTPVAKPRSETRQKHGHLSIRVTAAEKAEIEEAAEREGVSVGTFVRSRALAAPTTRATRNPSLDRQAIARLQAEMNRVGSNIHQIAKRINFGGTPAGEEITAAFKGYREVIAAILDTLGRGKK